ncbi:MAG: DNA recombination protein RmuC [Bacteroidaceae bacterium]|nr:DNA recombination protein RmuC [Bacteroidaceae bacterium]
MGNKGIDPAALAALEERVSELTTRNGELTTHNAELTTRNGEQTARNNELVARTAEQERLIAGYINEVKVLTAERDVQKATAENLTRGWNEYRTEQEQKSRRTEQDLQALKQAHKTELDEAKNLHRTELEEARNRYKTELDEARSRHKAAVERQAEEQKQTFEAHLTTLRDAHTQELKQVREANEKQLTEVREANLKQLKQLREAQEQQIETLREMNKKQVEAQLTLIKEQMKATSESVLKARGEELGERNKEQVSKIIDPLQKSLKDMQEAFRLSKEQQSEALTRLDETIKINMQKSMALGETADRLTRALTGEVKVQGNFGELKLKQLLEDLELKEGEQYDTQETLRDQSGKPLKGDEGKGLIPDFILHFPNNRHVVVDAKMSLTDYERYMNSEEGEAKTQYLQAHLASVRNQVRRLAKKDYTRYLPAGYNRLNFAIMYIPIEGALNLALLNDAALWREAYDEGVMILGPQTMYMNLRVLEMMWTQVRQLSNQQAMIDAANIIVDRVQDFGVRFMEVESSMNDTLRRMTRLKITTAESGPSIITAAKNLIKAGAKENKKKKNLNELDENIFIETDETHLIATPKENQQA